VAHSARGQPLQQQAQALADTARGRHRADLPGDRVDVGVDPQSAALAVPQPPHVDPGQLDRLPSRREARRVQAVGHDAAQPPWRRCPSSVFGDQNRAVQLDRSMLVHDATSC
jgi:hypothetical protein